MACVTLPGRGGDQLNMRSARGRYLNARLLGFSWRVAPWYEKCLGRRSWKRQFVFAHFSRSPGGPAGFRPGIQSFQTCLRQKWWKPFSRSSNMDRNDILASQICRKLPGGAGFIRSSLVLLMEASFSVLTQVCWFILVDTAKTLNSARSCHRPALLPPTPPHLSRPLI